LDREPRKESARRRTGRLLAIACAAHRIVDAILHHEQALVTALAQNPLSREANARLAAQRELQEEIDWREAQQEAAWALRDASRPAATVLSRGKGAP
jgi:hypothetical protein